MSATVMSNDTILRNCELTHFTCFQERYAVLHSQSSVADKNKRVKISSDNLYVTRDLKKQL